MSFRRRHRWTRRTLLGLAFAVMAAPASAQPLESPSVLGEAVKTQASAQPLVIPYLSHGLTAADVEPTVIPYLSHGLTAADVEPVVIPDVVERTVAAHMRTVDPVTGIPLSAGIPQVGDPFIVDPGSVRPDDRADRFAVGDGTPATTVTDDGFAIEWENGVTVGLGGLAIVLAIALALSYMRRPRIAL